MFACAVPLALKYILGLQSQVLISAHHHHFLVSPGGQSEGGSALRLLIVGICYTFCFFSFIFPLCLVIPDSGHKFSEDRFVHNPANLYHLKNTLGKVI